MKKLIFYIFILCFCITPFGYAHELRLAWDAAKYADGYKIYRVEKNSVTENTYAQIGETEGNDATEFVAIVEDEWKEYCFACKAFNTSGESEEYSNIACKIITKPKPDTVKNLSIIDIILAFFKRLITTWLT
jgi:hypothetical protein